MNVSSIHLSNEYCPLLSILDSIICFILFFSPSTYSALNPPFSISGLNTISNKISILFFFFFSFAGKNSSLYDSKYNLNTCLSSVFFFLFFFFFFYIDFNLSWFILPCVFLFVYNKKKKKKIKKKSKMIKANHYYE